MNRGMTENLDLVAPQPGLLRELYLSYAAANQLCFPGKQITRINPVKKYVQLYHFKEEMEASSLDQGPYTKQVQAVSIYKKIFFSFGLLFFVLWLIAFVHSTFFLPHPFYKGPLAISKVLLLGSCSLLALSSFILYLRLRPEKEAASQVIRRAQTKLHAIYKRKHLIKGWQSLFFFKKHDRRALLFSERYTEARQVIRKRYADALYLIDRIVKSKKLDMEQKEVLLNQALLELEDSFQAVLLSFHHSFFLAQCR